MSVTASQLRQDVYRLLDGVLETGKPVEIRRKGKVLRIVADPAATSKLRSLVKHDCIVGDPEMLVHVDWSDTWDENKALP